MKGLVLKRTSGFALVALAAVACTASPYVPEEKFAEASEARLVIVTGSRIPQMVDLQEHNPRLGTPTTVITLEDIQRTGEISLCRALKRIVPNMVGPDPGQGISSGRMIPVGSC